MSYKPILYLPIEVKSRETEGKTLLSLEAASRGLQVVTGHKSQIYQAIIHNKFPYGLFFYKDLSKASEILIENMYEKGLLIAGQDEESGLLSYTYDEFMSYRSTSKTVNMASSIFCWGNYDYESWIRHYPEATNKIHVTGSPRIDYWRHDFMPYFESNVNCIRQRFGCFVLIVSTFTEANNYLTVEQRIEQYKKAGRVRSIEDEQTARKLIEDVKKMFHSFVQLVIFLSEKYHDIHFVIRPHPAEKVSGWKDVLPKRDNIHVVSEGGISSWVRASSAVLQNGCTTGLEAYVTGVPVIAYVRHSDFTNRELANKLSINCTREDEVSEILSRIFKGETVDDHLNHENDNLIKYRLANVTGDTAVKRIIDVLEKLYVPSAQPIKAGFTDWKRGFKMEIRRYLDRIKGIETRAMRKFPGLRLRELKRIQNNLSRVDKKYKECTIKHLFRDVFVVEKR